MVRATADGMLAVGASPGGAVRGGRRAHGRRRRRLVVVGRRRRREGSRAGVGTLVGGRPRHMAAAGGGRRGPRRTPRGESAPARRRRAAPRRRGPSAPGPVAPAGGGRGGRGAPPVGRRRGHSPAGEQAHWAPPWHEPGASASRQAAPPCVDTGSASTSGSTRRATGAGVSPRDSAPSPCRRACDAAGGRRAIKGRERRRHRRHLR